ncbi:MAG: hypothetical protein RLZZ566_1838, partial [Pseudomonadota bacterium]
MEYTLVQSNANNGSKDWVQIPMKRIQLDNHTLYPFGAIT